MADHSSSKADPTFIDSTAWPVATKPDISAHPKAQSSMPQPSTDIQSLFTIPLTSGTFTHKMMTPVSPKFRGSKPSRYHTGGKLNLNRGATIRNSGSGSVSMGPTSEKSSTKMEMSGPSIDSKQTQTISDDKKRQKI